MPSKVYVIGMDGKVFTMHKRFVAEGILPTLKRLGDEGIVTESYSSFPAWTPTNWATLITGAHTGTHTVSRWFLNFPVPTTRRKCSLAFFSPAVAADKAGLKSIAIHYLASSSRAELSHTVDGFGHPAYGTSPFEVAPAPGYTNVDGIANSYQVRLQPAEGWQNLPASESPPLEFLIGIVTKREGENQNLMGLATDAKGDGYDTVVVCDSRD